MAFKIFKVMLVCLVAVFTICGLALLLSGLSTLLLPAGGGIGAYAGGLPSSFIKVIAAAIIVLVVGLVGLTRLRRFKR